MSFATVLATAIQKIATNGDSADYPAELAADSSRLLADAATLTDNEQALLALAIHIPYIRDQAWSAINRDNARYYARIWKGIALTLPPAFVTPAAFLAGYAAILAGDAADAREALDAALAADPDYSAAHLLTRVLALGVDRAEIEDLASNLPAETPHARWLIPLARRIDLHASIAA